jgi:predicted NAD/FAD-dependent oxidoreductase
MRRVPEAMAVGLEVHTQARVHRLAGDAGGVTAFTESGERFEADAVVCTAPAPQAFDLLDASGLGSDPAAREVVAELAYDPCLVVMALPAGPTALKNGHWADSAGPVAWIADNHHKGVSSVPAVTIHASAQYSTRYLEEDPSMWLPTVLGRARDVLGSDVEVVRTHRWRYSIPTTTLDVGAVEIASAPYPLWLAGEIYAGARVEGAFTSGIAAADALMART